MLGKSDLAHCTLLKDLLEEGGYHLLSLKYQSLQQR